MIVGYAVADVRAAEDRVRADLPEGELMQRAARGLAEVVAVRAEQLGARTVVVLAGPGDNGGDALWAASFLDGPDVTAVGVAPRLHPEGRAAARAAGVEVVEVEPDAETLPGRVLEVLAAADLVVDGLLGIGGRAGLRGAMTAVVDAVPDTAYLLAVDLPSGADPAGEEPLGRAPAVVADETVTFGMCKPVHLLPGTEAAVGRLTVVDIGVETDVPPVVERLEHDDVRSLWPVPGMGDHKYSRGVVGVVAGSEAYPGAAVLCVTSAVESGAGMVRYVGPGRPTDLVLAACPEVVPGPGRMQAAVVGPGVEPHGCDHPDCADHQADHVRELLGGDVPLVVDAGALELLASWVAAGNRRQAPTLLTPHAGELARLLTAVTGEEVTRDQVEAAPVEHVRRAAAVSGCTVLLKGSTTLVADPDPTVPVRSQTDAPAWLATAGAGDVLAGLAGVLLAAGLPPRDAGSLAALVHGVAADVANPGGPVRALAVARAIPVAVARLLGR
ncbi:bifunctional ADP-dependent NAD(P)H-hydrate dehydratase/NAD(P)H-hydrate epimerase [Ornithinimicrobium pekingense]|uniref:ADP-dependent (S)-NAD(P)H-hydrate dehydratase n=1 Tax=Ornithinimicrobium pekingense TaxID=384677 RepID=A0ABQ2FCF8_9MICO|nr:bifunctional ADP-dependent NAD(P)H-hydrate dehydratase/NAD(P)H-hydrate epimerase [Ornithinimicrobium pekingense]GGK80866.1 bifunctional NAD(P)H-hydrate repair enzyme [Ornithinimicrobium pekingense]